MEEAVVSTQSTGVQRSSGRSNMLTRVAHALFDNISIPNRENCLWFGAGIATSLFSYFLLRSFSSSKICETFTEFPFELVLVVEGNLYTVCHQGSALPFHNHLNLTTVR
eukprot:TRINITY_DN1028_c0_g1_i1.p1 TRINITY_DN1028_c0_g1~~TRINITY_DN1028_c0_g1_i1.p1  ORF type:complete len:109 (+),score=17.00 TRINITY_DN1028_c0_g1_i1:169-495(+)